MTSLTANALSAAGRLRPTDLTFDAGQLIAVVGPNGSGKTSLLRALAGVDRDATGEVCVAGEHPHQAPPARRPYLLGFLPAARDVPWAISARDVIALGLPRPDPARIDELVDLLELQPLADRAVDRLSTGERARVLLARVLAPRPRVLLLDEPCSNLDPYWAHRTIDILRSAASDGAVAVASIHDLGLLGAFDRVLMVHHGQVELDGPPETITGQEAFAAAFRVERDGAGWRISPSAGRQSSR